MSFFDKIRDRLFGFNSHSNIDDMPSPEISIHRTSTQPQQSPTPKNKTDLSNTDHSYPDRILFVCSGNICRSAYAAAKLKQLAQGLDLKIASAGTLRIVGRKAAPEMIDAARENGITLDEHRSTALSKLLIESSDIIFAMEPMHREIIIEISPDAQKRTLLLGMFLDEPLETLEDPMGQAPEVYRTVASQIDEALTNWFKRSKSNH